MIVEFWGMSQQERAQRRCAGSSAARRPPLRRLTGWLRPGRSCLPGRQPGPWASGQRVTLRDGSAVLIRQVQPSDAPLLADGFARLSAHSAGIRRFTALVATGNAAMTAMLDNAGATPVGRGPGTMEYEITLAPRQEPSLVWWFRSLDDIVFAWR
jgi:hypothetical protein